MYYIINESMSSTSVKISQKQMFCSYGAEILFVLASLFTLIHNFLNLFELWETLCLCVWVCVCVCMCVHTCFLANFSWASMCCLLFMLHPFSFPWQWLLIFMTHKYSDARLQRCFPFARICKVVRENVVRGIVLALLWCTEYMVSKR